MDYKLIALDIDGTLTNDEKEITPATLRALMRAQEKGIRLALVSARPTPGLYKNAKILNMAAHKGLLIAYNGGQISDAETLEAGFGIPIEMETARKILRFLEELPVSVILDDGKDFYVTDKNGYRVDYECRNNQMVCYEKENLADFLSFAPLKVLLGVDPEIIYSVQEKIAAALPAELTVIRTAPFYLEIIPRVINKGKALQDACAMMGITCAQAIAFGDAENDIPMLQEAGIGVAMANAEERVKEAADYVTLSNNEDGIAAALAHFIPTL